jgi:hypothetical protein
MSNRYFKGEQMNGIFIINYGNTFVCARQFARKQGEKR